MGGTLAVPAPTAGAVSALVAQLSALVVHSQGPGQAAFLPLEL